MSFQFPKKKRKKKRERVKGKKRVFGKTHKGKKGLKMCKGKVGEDQQRDRRRKRQFGKKKTQRLAREYTEFYIRQSFFALLRDAAPGEARTPPERKRVEELNRGEATQKKKKTEKKRRVIVGCC